MMEADYINNAIDSGEVLTSTLTDLTLRNKETSISMLLNSTAGKCSYEASLPPFYLYLHSNES
jgi:hypothetical protein